MEIELDLRKNIAENAKDYYERAKKAEKKVRGAKKALEETVKKREALEEKQEVLLETLKEKPEKKEKKERRWYDIFRSFTSSDDFFVVGGRDATTNDILIKKHMEKNDLVFHADITGAPFFLVKNPENKKIPQETILETAEMAASYSKAWARGLGSCDVYYVTPEQVSKTPKAGEYLGKGAFMIYGKKEWVRGAELRVAVGFKAEGEVEVVGGPKKMVEKHTPHYAVIGPGDKKSKQLAEEIKKHVLRSTGKEAGQKIKAAGLGEVQKWVPAGKGRIKK